MQCQAHKTNGEPCKANAITGKRVCRVHGGATPSGLASPHYKTGRYSKHLPTRLQARYEAAASDSELLALRDDIALTDARLSDLLARVDTGESGALWARLQELRLEVIACKRAGDSVGQAKALNALLDTIGQGHADYRAWAEVGAVLDQRRRLVESERKRLVEMQQTLTVEKAMLLIGAIGGIIKAHVQDRHVLAAISNDIQSLVSAAA